MTKLTLTVLAAILLFSACTKETPVFIPDADPEAQFTETSHRMSQGEAVAVLENFMATMDEDNYSATRSAAQARISQVRTAHSSDYSHRAARTRSSGGEEVLFYEMTLENGDGTEGFAVVVGDQRFPEVIAYCRYGSLADTVDIPAMAMFFREAAEVIVLDSVGLDKKLYLMNQGDPTGTPSVEHIQPETVNGCYVPMSGTTIVWDYFFMEDSTTKEEWPSWIMTPFWYSDSWLERTYESALVPYRWHQRAPYNNKAPIGLNGARATIGCAPLAMGTIMAYHRHPATYNWNAITQSISVPTDSAYTVAQNAVSQLLYDVAVTAETEWLYINGQLTGANPAPNYTMIISTVKPTFESLGYTCEVSANGATIDVQILANNFYRGLPVIISSGGYSSTTGNTGHAWIIDGMMIRKKHYYSLSWANFDFITGTNVPANLWFIQRTDLAGYMMHCLWGWTNEQGNGWYFNFTPIDTTIDITFDGNYSKALYSNIKPV